MHIYIDTCTHTYIDREKKKILYIIIYLFIYCSYILALEFKIEILIITKKNCTQHLQQLIFQYR